MDHWTTNLERLATKQPDLARSLQDVPLHNVRMMNNPAGLLVGQTWDVASQQWVSLCDPNDPLLEAGNDAAALWTREARVFCCFGLGLGYFPAALARLLLPYQRLAIFDPQPMHYVAMLHAIDAAPLQGERAVEIFIGDGLVQVCANWWLGLQSHEKLHIALPMRSGFTNGCNVAAYEDLMAKTGEMLRYHGVGLATWRQFGGHIGHSDWGNLPEYFVTPGFQELQGMWEGKPAVCIAAGPSLRKNLALLCNPEYRKKVAVITVGTTYDLLRALGIVPDIVTTIDFQELNWSDQFLHVPLDDAPPLVYLHSTYPSTVRRWPGVKYVGLNASDTTVWMAQFAEPKGNAGQVQSVAHLNVVVAQMLGANPIILLGQDLSMTPSEHHALGARAQDTPPQDSWESHIEMPGYDGNPVWSRQSLLSMKFVFEQLVQGAPGHTYINCTEGGLALEGVPNTPFAEVLTTLASQEMSLRPLVEAKARAYVSPARWDDLQQGLIEGLAGLQRVHHAAQNALAVEPLWQAESTPAMKSVLAATIGTADAVFQAEGLAFGQIAIRRFDIIELVSAIPPPPDTAPDVLESLNVERLLTVARAVITDYPIIQHILTQAQVRVQDIRDLDAGKPVTAAMFARQSYPAIARVAMNGGLGDDRALAALAWAQQRYQGIASLAPLLPAVRRLQTRTHKLLARNANRAHDVEWAYLAPRGE